MITAPTKLRYPAFCPTLPDPSEFVESVRRVFRSGRVTLGEQVAAFEEEICARTRAEHAVAVSSGTSGLMLLLKALDLPKGGEVIVPAFTFAATAHAILWNGLTPAFCDCDPHAFTMDPISVESCITERTAAICPVCVFGVPGDLDAYRRIADQHGLILLYDSAQGLGSTYKHQPVGGFGAGEVFSLSPTKVVTAIEGGVVTTNDGDLAERVRRLRDYGKAPDGEDMRWLGLSARMSEVNALIGRWSLARLDTWIERRARIRSRYRDLLGGVRGLSFQRIPPYCTSCHNYLVMLIDPEAAPIDRDTLHAKLLERGIQTKRGFYPPVHSQTLYRSMGLGHSDRLGTSERISRRALTLPMYSHMDMREVEDVCEQVRLLAGG